MAAWVLALTDALWKPEMRDNSVLNRLLKLLDSVHVPFLRAWLTRSLDGKNLSVLELGKSI